MRTTLTLDEDVAEQTRKIAARLRRPFKEIVNQALRAGLPVVEKPPATKPYRTKPVPMGLRPGVSLDSIQAALAQIEGEDSR